MAAILGVLGVDTGYHPAAALVVDGRIVAFAEEERFSGHKQAQVPFPTQSTAWCLKEAGLSLGDVDLIAYGWDCARYKTDIPLRMAGQALRNLRPRRGSQGGGSAWQRGAVFLAMHRPGWVRHRIQQGLRKAGYTDALPPIRWYPHHRCHAATAHYLSGQERTSTLIMDGSGEDIATTAYSGDGLGLRKLWDLPLPHSLGWFYSAFTEYLGFRHSRDEGKTMGLAAYGSAVPEFTDAMAEILPIRPGGLYEFEPSWGKFGRCSQGEHFSDRVVERFGEPRLPEAPLTQRHKDLAWAVQDRLERAVAALAGKLVSETGVGHLALAGGVAMNCKMNGSLLDAKLCDSLFVQPASDDSGAALGAALLGAVEFGDDPRTHQTRADFGPAIDPDEARRTLDACHLGYSEPPDIAAAAAEQLAAGKVVGWAQGRMESGARALGHRSILAAPKEPSMRDRVNLQVKRREAWRPYAPSMTAKGSVELFGDSSPRPFMIVAREALPEARERFGAVVHVDGSVRPQTVDPDERPLYHRLLTQLGEHTGSEVALNTSFNVRGQPIVRGPHEAIATFYSTGMDALALGPFLLTKG